SGCGGTKTLDTNSLEEDTMDIRPINARFLGIALLTAVTAAVSPPEALQAQEQAALQTGAAPELTDEKLGQYAGLHLAITNARDQFQAAKAAVHDLAARERLREEMDARLLALYEEHGMPK